jgi:4-amino-4-deoxy-L-arabinose transferase-like glycosyltransferase
LCKRRCQAGLNKKWRVVLQPPASTNPNIKFPTLKIDEKYLLYFPFVVLFALLVFKLGDIAGLHRDEAVFGLEALDILKGDRPISGAFNEYTSPIYYYILAAVFSLFGKSIWALRISGVFFNMLAALALADVMRRYSPKTAIYSLWFLATLPMVIILSRIAGENYAMNPFFLFGGIWCFAVLGNSESLFKSRIGYALAGLSFALGVWNHIIFAPTILAVAIVYILWCKPDRHQLKRILPPYFIGVFIAAIPKLYMILWLGRPFIPPTPELVLASPASAFLNLIYTLGGDGLYARSSGEILFSLNWFLPLCLLLSVAVLIVSSVSARNRRIYSIVASAMLLSCVLTWLISPGRVLGSRYWLLPLWFAPLVMGAAVVAIKKKEIRLLIAGVIVAVNLAAIGTNYFYAFSKTDGIPRQKIYVGGKYDNSTDFVDMRPMLNAVLRYNNKPFYVEDRTRWRIRFLTPKSQQDRVRIVDDIASPTEHVVPGSLFAFYRIPGVRFPPTTLLQNLKLSLRPQLSTSNYVVYEYIKS